jgi:hypothetical protein
MVMRRCQAIRRTGGMCGNPVLVDGSFCFAHSPTTAGRRAEASRRGGQNKAAVVRAFRRMPPPLQAAFVRLLAALDDVLDGALDPRSAQAAAAVAGALVRLYEQGELVRRVEALEQQLPLDVATSLEGGARDGSTTTTWQWQP